MFNARKIALTTITVVIAIGLLSYGYYQSRRFIEGPRISIESPQNGDVFTTPTVEIVGTARHISMLYLNDNQIFVDEFGRFSEKLLLSPGYNIITIEATDKFERAQTKRLELVLKEENVILPTVPPETITNELTENNEQEQEENQE